MLSEERIRELLDAHLPKPGPGWNNETLMSFPMAFGLAVAEAATAAERARHAELALCLERWLLPVTTAADLTLIDESQAALDKFYADETGD